MKSGYWALDNVLMFKDPRGWSNNIPNRKWNPNDILSWTEEMKAQVPDGIDPTDIEFVEETGVFFLSMKDVAECFFGFYYVMNRNSEGYSNNWYDVDFDLDFGKEKSFFFEIPQSKGDIYITIETYPDEMIPNKCYWGILTGDEKMPDQYYNVTILQNGVEVKQRDFNQLLGLNIYYGHESTMKAGDIFEIKVSIEWRKLLSFKRDYTVSVYSQQDIKIVDEKGEQNEPHYKDNYFQKFWPTL